MILRRADSLHNRKAFSVRPASKLVQSSGVVVPVALSFHVLRSRSPLSGPRGRRSVELALASPGFELVPSPWASSSCFSASASSSAPSSFPSGDPRIRAVGSSEALILPSLGCLPFRVCAARYGAVAHRHVVGSCVCEACALGFPALHPSHDQSQLGVRGYRHSPSVLLCRGRHLVHLGGTPYSSSMLVVALLRVRCRSRPRLLRRSGRPILGLRWYASPELSEVFVYHPLRARQNHMSIVLTALCSCCLRSSSAGAFHCISSSEKGVQAHRAIHEGRTAS